MTETFAKDLSILKESLANLPTFWEGKASVMTLKEAKFNAGQTEWWAFFFEHLCFAAVKDTFTVPGDKYGRTVFDLKRSVNWDLKAKAIKSDDHRAILNDKSAMEQSVERYGEQGLIVALCDVEYNDVDRTFEKWHTEIKGGKSQYQKARELRTNVSRYRKTQATLTELLFLRFTAPDLPLLDTMRQGRNSNGRPRPEKYSLNLENISPFLVDRLVFSPVDPEQHPHRS